jgi:hypothetical protein
MAVDSEDPGELDVQDFRQWWQQGATPHATEGRSRLVRRIATMLAFVCLASVVVVLALKTSGSGPPKGLPVAAAVDGGAAKGSGETPPGSPPQGGAVPQDSVVSTAPPAGPMAEAPSTAAPAAPPASQSPDARPVRSVTLRPDGAPVATPASTEPPLADAPKPHAASSPAAMNDALAIEPPVKPGSRAKSARPPTRVVVAKREATGGAAAVDPDNSPSSPPSSPETPARPEGPAKESRSAQVANDAAPAPDPPSEAFRKSVSRMLHVLHIGDGLIGERSAPAPQSVSGPASAGWAVQLAAPKSEAEAKSDLRRLGAQYASTLNGSKIGVHRAVVDGATVYRLRVVDLSKADASALCAKLKDEGGSCFVAR